MSSRVVFQRAKSLNSTFLYITTSISLFYNRDIVFYWVHSSHTAHNVGTAAEQRSDRAFGKLYISLTEADILPVGERKE